MASAVAVVVLGIVVTIAGCGALIDYALVADETGISGWNPMVWIVILAGIATTITGLLQIAHAATDRRASDDLDPEEAATNAR